MDFACGITAHILSKLSFVTSLREIELPPMQMLRRDKTAWQASGEREFNKMGGRGPLGRVRASHSDAATTPLRLRSAADD
jgi:hypothetical protein